jgi:aryl-alcohol dehydrogenase-like predicted oxidoreductase
MELALGTVQFGMPYGIAGSGVAVPQAEAAAILACAAEAGVRWLDTASAYGDAEIRLRSLMGRHSFDVVTKLRPAPSDLQGPRVAQWARAELDLSRERLGDALRALMFHRADDLLTDGGQVLWDAAARFAQEAQCALGVSCYEPATLAQLRQLYPIELAQLPGNALDQRIAQSPSQVPLHLRSAFLQGLLLMPPAQAAKRLPAAAGALARWHAWCSERGLAPLTAALGIVKGLPRVSHCVVGAERLAQFEAIARAWQDAPVLHAPELAVDDLAVIDPRQWKPGPV